LTPHYSLTKSTQSNAKKTNQNQNIIIVFFFSSDPLDWNGDHLHTNYRGMFKALLRAGYHPEILDRAWTCPAIAAGDSVLSQCAVLVIADPEEPYHPHELAHIRALARRPGGLSTVIFAEWYSPTGTSVGMYNFFF
jgi:hypothetical protein